MELLPPAKTPRLLLDLSWSALTKFLVVGLLLYIAIQLLELFSLLAIAILLAVTLQVFVRYLELYGVKRRYAIGALLLLTVGLLSCFGTFTIPALLTQMQVMVTKLPEIRQDILNQLPHGRIAQEVESLWAHPETLLGSWSQWLLSMGTWLTKGIYCVGIILVFAFYFLIDGSRCFEWIVTFFQPEAQRKLRETAAAAAKIMAAYVTGQMITSALALIYTAIVTYALGVPAWLILALLGGLLDVVPVLGVLILMAIASVLALSVSAMTALWVCIAILVYHGIENYLIAPRIYGRSMRLSNLAVLLAIACGALLAGPIGVILALPIAASYPPIERIWLKKYLGEEVVEKHKQLENA